MSTAPTPAAAPRARRRPRGARCVVTGGLGFIGSNVVHRLVGERRRRSSSIDALVPEHGGDRDQRRRASTSRSSSPTSATPDGRRRARAAPTSCSTSPARSATSRRCSDPLRDLDLNVRSHLALPRDAARASRPTATVVQTSTRQVYGRPRYLPVDEDHPTHAGRRQRHRQAGLRAVPPALRPAARPAASSSLRLTNVYGPRQHLERDGPRLPPGVRPPGPARRGHRAVRRRHASGATACTSTTSSRRCCWPRSTPEAAGEIVQPRPPRLADAGRDRPAHAARPPGRRARCAACRGPTSSSASTSAASRATSPRPSGSSAGRRTSRSPTASRHTIRSYRRSLVVPVVDLTRRHRRFEERLRRGDRPRARVRHRAARPRARRRSRRELAPRCTAPATRRARRRRGQRRRRRSQLALAALGIGPGDEVIVPAFTAVPTASAVCAVGRHAGARRRRPERPRPLDPAAVAARRHRPRRRPIVAVHLYGRPATVEPLLAPRRPGRRGRRPGPRRAAPASPASAAIVLLLPDEERRRHRRRRRRRHDGRRARRDASAACASTA